MTGTLVCAPRSVFAVANNKRSSQFPQPPHLALLVCLRRLVFLLCSRVLVCSSCSCTLRVYVALARNCWPSACVRVRSYRSCALLLLLLQQQVGVRVHLCAVRWRTELLVSRGPLLFVVLLFVLACFCLCSLCFVCVARVRGESLEIRAAAHMLGWLGRPVQC